MTAKRPLSRAISGWDTLLRRGQIPILVYFGSWMIRTQCVLFRVTSVRVEVNAMVAAGLMFLRLVIRTVLGAAVVVALVWLFFKLGKLADAYTKRL